MSLRAQVCVMFLACVCTLSGCGGGNTSAQPQSLTQSADVSSTAVVPIRSISLTVAQAAQSAVALTNGGDQMVMFSLAHNGNPAFQSRADMVDFVRAMPNSYAGEPFERKLWRFLVYNVYHEPPLSLQTWMADPWVVVNSLGWGLCDHVAITYALLAREAGYDVRVWGLGGHVVPEVFVEGRWRMYDPDLAVYYFGRDGEVAGVADLQSDPALITDPVTPVYPNQNSQTNWVPYSTGVANIYATVADNAVQGASYLAFAPSPSGRVWLPPHATLTYPGKWTDQPVGYDGTVPDPISYYKQARLDVPSGWRGKLPLPGMPWEITGSGIIVVNGVTYAVGTPDVRTLLQSATVLVSEIQIVESSGIGIVFFVNAARFVVDSQNTIILAGVNVDAISAGVVVLPAQNVVPDVAVLLPGQAKPHVN